MIYDHIPHWDSDEYSKFYKFQMNIPDINCQNCSLVRLLKIFQILDRPASPHTSRFPANLANCQPND